jgi:hypothetical protein
MPILRMLSRSAFEPSEVAALTQAFETVCRDLKFGQTDEPLRETVARKVIECAETGERDPERIRNHVLNEMQGIVSKPQSDSFRRRSAPRASTTVGRVGRQGWMNAAYEAARRRLYS